MIFRIKMWLNLPLVKFGNNKSYLFLNIRPGIKYKKKNKLYKNNIICLWLVAKEENEENKYKYLSWKSSAPTSLNSVEGSYSWPNMTSFANSQF